MAVTMDTVLSNGVTVADAVRSARRDLALARRALEQARAMKAENRLRSLRRYEHDEALAVGKVQGYVNLLTLLGVSENDLFSE